MLDYWTDKRGSKRYEGLWPDNHYIPHVFRKRKYKKTIFLYPTTISIKKSQPDRRCSNYIPQNLLKLKKVLQCTCMVLTGKSRERRSEQKSQKTTTKNTHKNPNLNKKFRSWKVCAHLLQSLTFGVIDMVVDKLLDSRDWPVSLNIMYQYSKNKRSKMGTTPERTWIGFYKKHTFLLKLAFTQ